MHLIVVHDGKFSFEKERQTKEAADYEYQHGVSLVNRKLATSVQWSIDGKPYRKWGV